MKKYEKKTKRNVFENKQQLSLGSRDIRDFLNFCLFQYFPKSLEGAYVTFIITNHNITNYFF